MGGQGIIFAGVVLARAAALYERPGGRELYAVQTQSYGPAARGATSKCDAVISDEPRFYPFVESPDFLVVMSQPAFEQYAVRVSSSTVVILDEDAVETRPETTHYEIPALWRAREIGHGETANVVMLGALLAISSLVSRDAAVRALRDVLPSDATAINEKALVEGYALASGFLAGSYDNV